MPLVEGMDALYGTFAERRRRVSGMLRIAAGQSSAAFMLPRFIHRFRTGHPGVRFRISRNAMSEAPRLLHAREVDLFFSGEKTNLTDTERYRVTSLRLRPHHPPRPPAGRRDSGGFGGNLPYPAVVPASGTPSRKIGGADGQPARHRDQRRGGGPRMGAIKRYVEAGLGVSIVPDFCLVEQDRVSVIPLPTLPGARLLDVRVHRRVALVAGHRTVHPFRVPPPPPPPAANDGRFPGIDEYETSPAPPSHG